ncbi:MAG: DEAD/DEAH box helicase [Desulfurococcales archaeon ex4484_58]|nr:MAG: DEAD/DEAH box helicase [Desulfurococcales archaeon ex4484_58]
MDVDCLIDYGLPNEYIELLRERGISKLNPVQRMAVSKGLFNGKNLVVAAPTASGKTLIGELGLVKNIYNGGMGVYLVPLRALASEKFEELSTLKKIGFKIGISTGDYDLPAEHLGRNDLVVATYERFDSLLRLKPRWINRIKCLVIDELHMINDPERGPIIEMIIARILGRDIQVIGLSATIGNPHVLAKWIRAELVDVSWRPVKLVEGYYNRRRGVIFYNDGRVERVSYRVGNSALNIAIQSILNDLQVLVFVHNRRRAEEWAENIIGYLGLYKHLVDKAKLKELLDKLKDSPSKLEREKIGRLISNGVAYHHAGLSSIARKVVEEAFRDHIVRVVFATPTLAAGVNLPARRVLVSIKRYDPRSSHYTNIPVFEYKQMAGRAGRPQYDDLGEAIIYDAQNDREGRKYIYNAPEPVTSKLSGERSLRIHVLALVSSNKIMRYDELLRIFKNTLYYETTRDHIFLENGIKKIIGDLSEWGMVNVREEYLEATRLGIITSITYLDPLSVHRYLNSIDGKPGELYYLHILASTPDYLRSRPYISERIVDEYEDEALLLAEEGIIPKPPLDDEYEYYSWLQSYVQAKMLHDWINEVDEDSIMRRYGVGPGDIYSARDTASWIAAALSRVEATLGNEDRSRELDILSKRLEYGIKEDAIELVELEGVGRVRARTLIDNGIRSLRDLANTPLERLLRLPGFGPKLVKSIKEQLKRKGY